MCAMLRTVDGRVTGLCSQLQWPQGECAQGAQPGSTICCMALGTPSICCTWESKRALSNKVRGPGRQSCWMWVD